MDQQINPGMSYYPVSSATETADASASASACAQHAVQVALDRRDNGGDAGRPGQS